MRRRTFLKGAGASAVALLHAPMLGRTAQAQTTGAWRTFEVTTRVEMLQPSGVTRAWIPLPLAAHTDYHKPLGNRWSGNTTAARAVRDPKYGAEMLYAEWAAGEKAPMVEVISTFSTPSTR